MVRVGKREGSKKRCLLFSLLLLTASVTGVYLLSKSDRNTSGSTIAISGSTAIAARSSCVRPEVEKYGFWAREQDRRRSGKHAGRGVETERTVSRKLLEGVGRYLRDPVIAYRLRRFYEMASAVLDNSGIDVDPWLLISICLVETGCDPLVVRDETLGVSRRFRSYSEACAYVKRLRRKGHLYAIGLGQVVPRYWRKFVPEQDECMLLIPAKSFLVMGRIIQELADRYGWRWQAIAAYNGNPYRRRPRRYARSVIARYSVISSYFVE